MLKDVNKCLQNENKNNEFDGKLPMKYFINMTKFKLINFQKQTLYYFYNEKYHVTNIQA